MSRTNIAKPETWLWHKGGIRTPWDELRKDVDLWHPSGDCLVYLYAHGASQRQASFQIPLDLLYAAECASLLVSSRSTSLSVSPLCPGKQQIFIGAPKDLNRQDTLRWHITTRNFFAWLMGKPLAGKQLGLALSDLLGRMKEYRQRDTDCVDDLLAFMAELGYSQLAHQSENAVAMLVLAERQKLRPQWLNAFSHCVGMSEAIEVTPDYEALSKVNRALITEAALQMDIDLEAKARSVAVLLENEFTKKTLGIPSHTLPHLDHFRAFIQSHLVSTYGYWPPRTGSFSRPLYSSMHHEFDCLLRYIGNLTTTAAEDKDRVLGRFDAQHNYQALNISRSLLPHLPFTVSQGQGSTGAFNNIKWRKAPRPLSVARVRAEHIAATNQKDPQVLQSPLVKAFARFEEENAAAMHRDISYEDARRTCFLLVYCMLQTFKSITRAAPEVTETQEVVYPLCCDTSALPSWSKLKISPLHVSPVVLRSGSEASQNTANSALGKFQSFSIDPDARAEALSSTSHYVSRSNSTKCLSEACVVPRTQSIVPLRTGSLRRSFGLTRSSRLTRTISNNSTKSYDRMDGTIETIHDPTSPAESESEDGTTTSDGDAPSLNWSRWSSKSVSSATDSNGRQSMVFTNKHSPNSSTSWSSYPYSPTISDDDFHGAAGHERSLSRSSSVYSERIAAMPQKPAPTSDVLDKGLAGDETLIIPGLF